MEVNVAFYGKDITLNVGMDGTSVEIGTDLENTGEDMPVAFEQDEQAFGASFEDDAAHFPVEFKEVQQVEAGTTDHSRLKNRDAANQHPMSAITGLEKALEEKQPAGAYLTKETDPTVPEWAKQPKKPGYTASEVGADPSGAAASALKTAQEYTDKQIAAIPTPDVSGQINAHNTATDAHNDLRLLIAGLTERLNALANSDDTTLDQMAEVVAYIKDNRELIEQVTTGKVSVADIVDNLATNVPDKPLSAAQGVVLRGLIDSLTASLDDKLDVSALTAAVNIALAQAKESGEFDGEPGQPGYTPVKGTDYFTPADKGEIVNQVIAGLPTGTVQNAVTLSTNQTVTGVKTFTASNFFDGEQKLTFGQYCPTVTDIASGIGASMKNARAVDCQLYVAEVYAPYWSSSATHGGKESVSGLTAKVGQIDFYIISGASAGQPTGRKLIMSMKEDGLYILGKKVLTE